MDLKLNENNELVSEDGSIFKVNNETVKVLGVFKNQEQVNNFVKKRVTDKNNEIKDLNTKISEIEDNLNVLKSQKNPNPELQNKIDNLTNQVVSLKSERDKAEEEANNKVASQVSSLTEQNNVLTEQLSSERDGRVKDHLTYEIINAGSNKFNSTKRDVVPYLLNRHIREPKLDESTGNKIEGEYVDLFEMTYFDEKTKAEKTTKVEVNKAVELFAANPENHYYLLNNQSGTRPTLKDFQKQNNDNTPTPSANEKISSGLKTLGFT